MPTPTTIDLMEGENMKKRTRRFAAMGMAVGALLAISVPALAGQGSKETHNFDDVHSDTIPAGFVCDFPVGIHEEVKGSDTLWFDSEGELEKVHVKVNGTTVWSGPGGSATEHWAWSGWFDAEAMTFSQAGNIWNVHQNGLVIHDKGLIVFDDNTGDVLKVAGPHEVFDEGLGALCAAIS